MPQATSRSNTPKIRLPKELPSAARQKVEDAIEGHLAAVEALTAFLDASEAESDLEPDVNDEPSLGWTEGNFLVGDWCQPGDTRDLEECCEDEGGDHDGREDDEIEVDTDFEPLGHPEHSGGSYGAA